MAVWPKGSRIWVPLCRTACFWTKASTLSNGRAAAMGTPPQQKLEGRGAKKAPLEAPEQHRLTCNSSRIVHLHSLFHSCVHFQVPTSGRSSSSWLHPCHSAGGAVRHHSPAPPLPANISVACGPDSESHRPSSFGSTPLGCFGGKKTSKTMGTFWPQTTSRLQKGCWLLWFFV